MANLALSTQIPQIGDSSQQLLARMAAAAADQNQPISEINWLASAARTTTQSLNLTIPNGVVGIKFYVQISSVPGIDGLYLVINDQDTGVTIGSTNVVTTTSVSLALFIKTGCVLSSPVSSSGVSIGLTNKITILIVATGAGSFVYSAKYVWLKK